MSKAVLAVRAQDYLDYVGTDAFMGLPREEIERLHDIIPVRALEQPQQQDLPLAAYAAFHHNYAWLTGLGGPGTLGKHATLHAEGTAPSFLDDKLHALARRQLEQQGLPEAPSEWRLAGLLNHGGQLSLVYVVRLRQRWDSSEVRGNTELRFGRASYDAPSQLIIDHLHAF